MLRASDMKNGGESKRKTLPLVPFDSISGFFFLTKPIPFDPPPPPPPPAMIHLRDDLRARLTIE